MAPPPDCEICEKLRVKKGLTKKQMRDKQIEFDKQELRKE